MNIGWIFSDYAKPSMKATKTLLSEESRRQVTVVSRLPGSRPTRAGLTKESPWCTETTCLPSRTSSVRRRPRSKFRPAHFPQRTPTSSSLLSTDRGSAAVRELFFTELTIVFDAVTTFNHHVIFTGDFNIRVNDGDDKNSRKQAELLQSCGFVQSVISPTHTHGNTLDLVITRSDLPRPVVTVDLPQISDHSLIRIELSIPRPPLQFVDVNSRAWKSFDSDRFRSDLLTGPLCQPNVYNGMSIDQLQDLYDTTLSTLLEKHAPR